MKESRSETLVRGWPYVGGATQSLLRPSKENRVRLASKLEDRRAVRLDKPQPAQ